MIELEQRLLPTLSIFATPTAVVGDVVSISITSYELTPTWTPTDFGGIVTFTSSDPQATLPSPIYMAGPWLMLPIKFGTPGTQTIAVNGVITTIEVTGPIVSWLDWVMPPLTAEQIQRIYAPREQVIFFSEPQPLPTFVDEVFVCHDDGLNSRLWEDGPLIEDSDGLFYLPIM